MLPKRKIYTAWMVSDVHFSVRMVETAQDALLLRAIFNSIPVSKLVVPQYTRWNYTETLYKRFPRDKFDAVFEEIQ